MCWLIFDTSIAGGGAQWRPWCDGRLQPPFAMVHRVMTNWNRVLRFVGFGWNVDFVWNLPWCRGAAQLKLRNVSMNAAGSVVGTEGLLSRELGTVRLTLTSTGNPVPGNKEFCLAPNETMVEQGEKIRSLTQGIVWRWIPEEICLILDYL